MKKLLTFVVAFVLLVNLAAPAYAVVTDTNGSTSVSYYFSGDNIVEKIVTLDESQSPSTIVRTVFPDGTMQVSVNGVAQGTLKGASYAEFFVLAGGNPNALPSIAPDAPIPFTNYGCGHNDKIHVSYGSTTATFYKEDIAILTSISAIVDYLVTKFKLPYSDLVDLATLILSLLESDTPDKQVVTERTYDVLSYGSNDYLFTCHHFLIGDYAYVYIESSGRYEYRLIDSYEYFTQTIG